MKQPEIGRLIAKHRIRQKLTQQQIATECNINIRTIQRIESGKVMPRLHTLKLLSGILEFDFQAESEPIRKHINSRIREILSQIFAKPKISVIIVLITLIGTILSIISNKFLNALAFSLKDNNLPNHIYTYLSYSIIHVGFYHWFFSSIHVLFFGSVLERHMKPEYYIALTLSSIVIGPIYLDITNNLKGLLAGSGFFLSSYMGGILIIIRNLRYKSYILNIVSIIFVIYILDNLFFQMPQIIIPKTIAVIYGVIFMLFYNRIEEKVNS